MSQHGGTTRWAGTAGQPAWHVGRHPWPSTARSFWVVSARPTAVLGRVGPASLFSGQATDQNERPDLLDRSMLGPVNQAKPNDQPCETSENPDFLRKNKIVISVKIRNFSRSRMTKRTSPLESSSEI